MRYCFFLILFTFLANLGHSQILDDTTQNVYGPETTRFIRESAIKYGIGDYQALDTMASSLHQFSYVDRYDNMLQNLGNLGTAAFPVFYDQPDQIGAQTGFHVYDYLWKGPDWIKYYDTKSPFTDINLVFAGNQRNMINVSYSRNINPNWNFGFNYVRLSATKQLSRISSDDRQVFNNYYDLYTRYKSKDDKYQLLANIARMNHTVEELGGILALDTTYFLYEDADVILQEAQSRAFKINLHLFHQYQIDELLQLYHEFDIGQEFDSYIDRNVSENQDFYDEILLSDDSTIMENKLNYITNEFGIKGSFSNVNYGVYAKRRDVRFIRKYINSDNAGENYLGVFVNMKFDSLHTLSGQAEYLFPENHKIEADYRNKFFEASYRRYNRAVPFFYRAHFGNHHEWYNNFKPQQSDYLYGAINLPLKKMFIRPQLHFRLFNNYLFFGTEKTPQQAGSFAQIITPGVDINFNFGNFKFHNKALYSLVTGGSQEVFRVPELFVNSTISYGRILYGGRLELNGGVNLHYRTAYRAYGYDPVVRQFYILPPEAYNNENNSEENGAIVPRENGYLVADLFLDLKIGQVRTFFKFIHLNQATEDGYFTTPFFSGQKRTLAFGINWMFFN